MAGNEKKAESHSSNGHNRNNGHGSNDKTVQIPHFASKLISAIPHGRKGKHNLIVSMILDDLEALDPEKAVLIPLAGLEGEKMENVRSALNRATRQPTRNIFTYGAQSRARPRRLHHSSRHSIPTRIGNPKTLNHKGH
jgi:hypothetical protein